MIRGTSGANSSEYVFNGLGYLVRNIQVVDGITKTTDYVIDYTSAFQSVLAKYEAGGLYYRNVFGLDRISTTVTDSLNSENSLKMYIQNDRLGSGRFASDTNGELVVFTDMDEWGNVITKTIPTVGEQYADVLNNFTNHEFDEVLGVYYAKARFYDPVDRRFLAVDPVKGTVENPQSMVQYLYALNDPINMIDPDGRSPVTTLPELIPVVRAFMVPSPASAALKTATPEMIWVVRTFMMPYVSPAGAAMTLGGWTDECPTRDTDSHNAKHYHAILAPDAHIYFMPDHKLLPGPL